MFHGNQLFDISMFFLISDISWNHHEEITQMMQINPKGLDVIFVFNTHKKLTAEISCFHP